jgi:hypothetical protein
MLVQAVCEKIWVLDTGSPERGVWEAQLRERPIAGYYET